MVPKGLFGDGRFSYRVEGDAEHVRRGTALLFWCPGCDLLHRVQLAPWRGAGPAWEWTGDPDRPTVTPSIRTQLPGAQPVLCHLFLREGRLAFLDDCSHALRGTTVAPPPLPDWAR